MTKCFYLLAAAVAFLCVGAVHADEYYPACTAYSCSQASPVSHAVPVPQTAVVWVSVPVRVNVRKASACQTVQTACEPAQVRVRLIDRIRAKLQAGSGGCW